MKTHNLAQNHLPSTSKKRRKKIINATMTPLASIFGSGFLVIIPILNGAVGAYSVVAMVLVCALAYGVGSIIRYNIRHAEPLLENNQAHPTTTLMERLADFSIVLAYIISVCLYLRILASFLLGGLGIDTNINEQILTTVIILVIGLIGLTKGLKALEFLEDWALWVTLFIITILLISFGIYDLSVITGSGIQWSSWPGKSTWEILTILGGTLIVVQGFETSRYLEAEFDTETRISSCRLSQIVSTVVYLAFIALATPLTHSLGGKVEDNGLLILVAQVSTLLSLPLVLAAVMSQFSAAVADTFGGTGNMIEASGERITEKMAYMIICTGAIILTWSAQTLQILAIASRSFAFYYALQCLVAFTISRNPLQKLGMAFLAGCLIFITIFAVPAG